MKQQVAKYSLVFLMAWVCIGFAGGEKKQYSDLFQKIKAHMNPEGNHFIACQYAFFKDSLATKPTHTLLMERWRVGDKEVTQTELMHIIREGDKQLILDKESNIIAFGPLNTEEGFAQGYEAYLDSLLSGNRVQLVRNTKGTSTLLVKYPWSSPISASTLTFNHESYEPKRASLYTRVPQLIAEGEWAIQPRIDIDYQQIELGVNSLPEAILNYVKETSEGYQLQDAYRDYEFINQFND